MVLLNRSGMLSDARLARGIEWMRNHGKVVKHLHTSHSSGPRTARAVALLADLDHELRQRSGGKHSLDDVVKALRSEEHTSELQSLMRISYAVFCLKTEHNSINHSLKNT